MAVAIYTFVTLKNLKKEASLQAQEAVTRRIWKEDEQEQPKSMSTY
jgi:hypothetical protein